MRAVVFHYREGRGAMIEIELEPDLSSCIQTIAKREYDIILRELLQTGEESKELQGRLETLKLFLESVDFGKLRSEYEKYLLAGKRVKFFVQAIDGQVEYKTEIS